MYTRSRFRSCVWLLVVSIALLATSCAATPTTPGATNPTTKPTTTDTTNPTTKPTTIPSSTEKKSSQFQIDVLPEQLNGFSIAGQRCVFLITALDEAQIDEDAIEISASANDADIFIDQKSIKKNQVAEVTVIPTPSSTGKLVEVDVTGTRGDVTVKKTVSFEVIEGEDDRKDYAVELRDRFVAWLAKNKPELNLSSNIKWIGTMVSPQWLVVSHYLFFSDEWEMHVEWHIMVAPDDWARIDLRHRFDETKPSYAFEISSREGDTEPKPIEVPEMIWR